MESLAAGTNETIFWVIAGFAFVGFIGWLLGQAGYFKK
jgi:hypothetical protein